LSCIPDGEGADCPDCEKERDNREREDSMSNNDRLPDIKEVERALSNDPLDLDDYDD